MLELVCVCACRRVCVLFALREVRRHAWSALHCLTVVFSRCHWLGVLWCGDGIMCAGPSWVEKRGEQQRPWLCHSSLPRHLIVRKVSAEPSGPSGSAASLSAGQTERHSVLGPGSFFPFSQRLCLASQESKGRKCQITPMSLKLKVFRTEMSFAVVFCVIHDDVHEGARRYRVCKLVFFFSFHYCFWVLNFSAGILKCTLYSSWIWKSWNFGVVSNRTGMVQWWNVEQKWLVNMLKAFLQEIILAIFQRLNRYFRLVFISKTDY